MGELKLSVLQVPTPANAQRHPRHEWLPFLAGPMSPPQGLPLSPRALYLAPSANERVGWRGRDGSSPPSVGKVPRINRPLSRVSVSPATLALPRHPRCRAGCVRLPHPLSSHPQARASRSRPCPSQVPPLSYRRALRRLLFALTPLLGLLTWTRSLLAVHFLCCPPRAVPSFFLPILLAQSSKPRRRLPPGRRDLDIVRFMAR